MSGGKKIPYGISNFEKLILQDYIFVDKTKYIEILENYSETYIFFLRPRRFGKSLFISLLNNYYDINAKEQFPQLFDDLYIGKNVTPLANSYYILNFNFSGINTSRRDLLLLDFTRSVVDGLNLFLKKYNLDIDYRRDGMPSEIFRSFLTAAQTKLDRKIYVLIDEYDHFANELLSFQVDVFEETISKTGFVRKWYEVLKIGTGTGIVDRIFATGVSPVTLDGLTSGFNIASNLTRDPNLNEMMGFTQDEVIGLIKKVLGESIDPEALLPELKQYYNGYLFSEDGQQRVFNSDMILYYLNSYKKYGKPPIDLIDTNISSDYARMQGLFSLKNKERNYLILEQILNDVSQTTTITREYSLAKEFTEEDFLSLLFYLGLLTIEDRVINRVTLKVPNYAIKGLYFDFFAKVINKNLDSELKISGIKDSIEKIALYGEIKDFINQIEETLHQFSQRDFIKFDEKYIKLVMLTYLMLSKIYYVKSEYEVKDGYIDIAFFKQKGIGEESLYEGLLELKYIKKSDYDKMGDQLVENKLAEGMEQLMKYQESEELQGRKKLLKWVLVFVGDKCMKINQIK